MLLELNVQNFLIIDKLSVSFKEGFNVITGETGSGKSIILDCISIVLGDRASPALIRKNEDRAIISCVFKIKNKNLIEKLYDACFLDSKNESLLIIKKVITKNGSRISINERPTTINFVSELSSDIIEINSQFEQSALCVVKNYLEILDNFCKINTQLKTLEVLFDEYYLSKTNLENKINLIKKIKDEEEFYQDVIKETDIFIKSGVKNKEGYLTLVQKRDSFLVNEKLHSKIEDFYNKIYAIKSSRKFDYLISDIENLNNNLQDDNLKNSSQEIQKMLEEVRINIDESFNIFSERFMKISFDKNELERSEELISEIRRFARKHKIQAEDVFDFRSDIEDKLSQIGKSEDDIEGLKKDLNEKFDKYKALSNEISQIRKNKAQVLESLLIKKLEYLSLPSVRFKVFFEEKEPSKNGCDDINFKVSMNPGVELTTLSKCASGGEISRFMLAFKSVLAQENESSALIFDEIDTGVSGKVAFNIGIEMKKLSKTSQIICITHNTQVAACGDHQFLVAKKVFEEGTKTALKELSQEERIRVLAYMLSNGEINEDNLKNAQSILQEAQKVA